MFFGWYQSLLRQKIDLKANLLEKHGLSEMGTLAGVKTRLNANKKGRLVKWINATQWEKVVPFNSMHNLKKDLKSRLSHFHSTRTQAHSKSANKENAHTVTDQK